MRLYFIRHGQSENNALWEATRSNVGRSDDPELTGTGHDQARRLADYVLKTDTEAYANGKYGVPRRDFFGITHVYTSLMIRSVDTASYLAKALDLPLTGWPEIHECGGIFTETDVEGARQRTGGPGKTRAFFAEKYTHLSLPETVTDEGGWNRGFEEHEERPLRAKKVLETLLEKHGNTDDVVALVSHAGFYNELIRVIFDVQGAMTWFNLYNTAVSRIEFRGGEKVLMYHNRTEHLPDHLIT